MSGFRRPVLFVRANGPSDLELQGKWSGCTTDIWQNEVCACNRWCGQGSEITRLDGPDLVIITCPMTGNVSCSSPRDAGEEVRICSDIDIRAIDYCAFHRIIPAGSLYSLSLCLSSSLSDFLHC